MKRMVWVLGAAATCGAIAADLTLTGSGTVKWNRTDAVWKNSAGDLQTYTDGDNVLIGGTEFSGEIVQLDTWLNPGHVVFSNEQEIALTQTKSDCSWGSQTKSLSKWGPGVLRLKAQWNYNRCPWHVYQGTLSFVNGWSGEGRYCGDTQNGLSPMIYVHDGGTLENPSSGGLGAAGAADEDNCASVTVYTNGVFRPGWETYAYPKTVLKDLIFDGGTFDSSRRGSWGWGLLKVTRKLAFKGVTPYAISFGGQDAKLMFAASRQTKIDVDDITGDAEADVTFNDSWIGRGSETSVVGFQKTGSGTLVFKKEIYHSLENNARGWLGLTGPIGVDAGVLRFESEKNAFTGRVEVTGGTLELGAGISTFTKPTDPACSHIGSLVSPREVVASGDGRIVFRHRYMFDALSTEGNEPVNQIFFVARDGGELHIGREGMTTKAQVTFPNLWLDGGSVVLQGDGDWPKGVMGVVGTFKFSGPTPYTFEAAGPVSGNSQVFCLNANSKTCFEVADITGDAATDVTFAMPMGLAGTMCAEAEKVGADGSVTTVRSYTNGYDPNISVGFRKTGPGTLRLAFSCGGLGSAGMLAPNGIFTVEEGALEVDADIYYNPAAEKTYHFGVSVCDGAYLQQPSPQVEGEKWRVMKTLALAEGGGLRVFADRTASRYIVAESLTLPTVGRIDLVIPEDWDARSLSLPVLSVSEGCTVSGATDFSGWTFTVNGKAASRGVYAFRCEGGQYYVTANYGTTILLR